MVLHLTIFGTVSKKDNMRPLVISREISNQNDTVGEASSRHAPVVRVSKQHSNKFAYYEKTLR